MNGGALDAVDRAILHHLQADGRKPVTDIAAAVNVADNTVRNRIHAMEETGVIEGFTVQVDYDRADVQHYYMFVCTARVSDRERLAEQIRGLFGVVEVVTLMTGTHNVYVVAAGTHKDDVTQLAYDLDEAGLRIDHEYLIRDHVRQPYEGFALERNL